MKHANLWMIVGLCSLLAACATLDPDYEEPVVNMTSIRPLPSDGMAPNFEVTLDIVNPNDFDLNLAGIVYTIELEGHELVKSVGKDFPAIEAYSEQTVTLVGSVNLMEGIRLFADLMRSSGQVMDYTFDAKLDLTGLYPSIHVTKTGELNLEDHVR